jgi:thiamine-phosphate pyrophosphorylase
MRGLYLVTDRDLCGGQTLDKIVVQAVKGGVSYVQLREKAISTRAFVEESIRIKTLLAPFRIPLIINDRIDVALASGAEGVHIGQQDMPYPEARRLMGRKAIIGLSVETWRDVEEAETFDADYIGVSPVFPTPTKTNTRDAWGLAGLTRIKTFSRHKLVAIGGINESNVEAVMRAGADGVAVVSAICAADNPEAAAGKIRKIIDSIK